MRLVPFGTALAALCVYAMPSFAASAASDAFVANVRLNAAFLGKASSMADDRSEHGGLRAFADKEASAEAVVIDMIDRRTAPEIASAAPMTVASAGVMTGRSVAVDPAPLEETLAAPVGTGALMPAAMITLDRLSASKGQAFDTLYRTTQVQALRQLAGLYEAYSMTGDDAALKQMAKRQLATTNDLIAELARI